MWIVLFKDLAVEAEVPTMIDHRAVKTSSGSKEKAVIYYDREVADNYVNKRNEGNTRFKFYVADVLVNE